MSIVSVSLTTSIYALPGVREYQAQKLEILGVRNVGQLLTHLPHRHEWVRAQAGIADLEPGVISSAVGEITATKISGFGRKARFQAVLHDGDGRLDLVFFNQSFLAKKIPVGTRLRVQGKPTKFGPGLQMANPQFTIIPYEDESTEPVEDDAYRPVYPATEGLPSEQIWAIVKSVLKPAVALLEDHLDDSYRQERALPSLREAYRMMHAPEHEDEVKAARRRLAYDELLMMQLGVHMKRAHLRRTLTAPALERTAKIDEHIAARMPFALTAAQQRVVDEISRDVALTTPTNRLVQGDVGSGKTAVALDAMLLAIAHEHQAALMAPTELLAEQHYLSITEMLKGSSVRVELLTGSMPASDRAAVIAKIASGEVDLVIGTHALISDRVEFHSLALVVIDEQHRFGVEQRAKLRVKGGKEHEAETPHVIVMTATPIPRTIGLTIFGDLDISTIDELPPGRSPVITKKVTREQRKTVYQWVNEKIKQGDQAFIVVPAIEPGKKGEVAVTDLRTLQKQLEGGELHDVKVAALHGRLKRDTREHVMHRFRAGKIDALIATTVIEVGVDVPNATMMIIEDADRFGLAQLHQLRGRVGRGQKPGVCVLIGNPKTEDGIARLNAMVETTSGFVLAEKDLDIRGAGDVFGTRQSGMMPFKVADPMKDTELLQMARRDAAEWIAQSPTLERPEDTLARRRMLKAHGQWLGLGDVG
ncbi:MAG: ATP-dependent DNA helicase RecG [Phycisphaerae bacterium]|nr:ATP-dependent DNA helicase RecG [Phycisphaerae bacterium]MBM91232.1 ATP-dependent DNA helicase RecG [Phycisphaerae bacterium]